MHNVLHTQRGKESVLLRTVILSRGLDNKMNYILQIASMVLRTLQQGTNFSNSVRRKETIYVVQLLYQLLSKVGTTGRQINLLFTEMLESYNYYEIVGFLEPNTKKKYFVAEKKLRENILRTLIEQAYLIEEFFTIISNLNETMEFLCPTIKVNLSPTMLTKMGVIDGLIIELIYIQPALGTDFLSGDLVNFMELLGAPLNKPKILSLQNDLIHILNNSPSIFDSDKQTVERQIAFIHNYLASKKPLARIEEIEKNTKQLHDAILMHFSTEDIEWSLLEIKKRPDIK